MIGLMMGLWQQASRVNYGFVLGKPPTVDCGCAACRKFFRLVRKCPLRMESAETQSEKP